MSFRRYESCRDTGVEWLGEVPEHWPVCGLGQRYEVALGKMLDEKKISGQHLGPYLRNVDVQWDRINTEDLPEMDFSGEDLDRYSLTAGDLLVCEGGEVGRAAIWRGGLTICFYQKALHRLRSRNAYDHPRYLFYVLRAAYDADAFTAGAGKATIAHLPADVFRKHRFPFPPLEEQLVIAAFLDRETAKIDALVGEQRRLIELLKEKRQAVISHAVTRGLNPAAPLKESGIESLGRVPEHWGVLRLKQVATVQTGVAKGKDFTGRDTVSVPYLRVANVQAGSLNLDDVATVELPQEDIDRYLLRVGDVLMNEGGDYDKLGRGDVWRGQIEPCIHQNHVFAVRPTGVEPEWVNLISAAAYARHFFIERSKQSTNLASISSTNLMELTVTLPPREERLEIIKHVATSVVGFTELQQNTERAIEFLQERRAALISAAVTGKIDVRDVAREVEAA